MTEMNAEMAKQILDDQYNITIDEYLTSTDIEDMIRLLQTILKDI